MSCCTVIFIFSDSPQENIQEDCPGELQKNFTNHTTESSQINKGIDKEAAAHTEDSGICSYNKSDSCDKQTSETVKLGDSVSKNASSAEKDRTSTISVPGGGSELAVEPKLEVTSTKDDINSSSKSSDVKCEGEENKAVKESQLRQNVSVRTDVNTCEENLFCEKLLHPVAGIHTALLERRARRQALFGGSGPYKRALSARRDLAIR